MFRRRGQGADGREGVYRPPAGRVNATLSGPLVVASWERRAGSTSGAHAARASPRQEEDRLITAWGVAVPWRPAARQPPATCLVRSPAPGSRPPGSRAAPPTLGNWGNSPAAP